MTLALIIALALGGAAKPSPFAGEWAGPWRTSVGTHGSNYLCIAEHEGALIGTWDGFAITDLKINDRQVTWSLAIDWRRYQHVFSLGADGKRAQHKYEVIDLERMSRGYTGATDYERHPAKGQLSGLWLGEHQTSEGVTKHLSLCLAQTGNTVVGNWNGNDIKATVKDGVVSWQNSAIAYCRNYGMTITIADDAKTAKLDYVVDDFCAKTKSAGTGTLTKQ